MRDIAPTVWVVAALMFVALAGGYAAFYVETKPRCPDYATAKFTRQGWYCTVPPIK